MTRQCALHLSSRKTDPHIRTSDREWYLCQHISGFHAIFDPPAGLFLRFFN